MLCLLPIIILGIFYFMRNNDERNYKDVFSKAPDTILKERYVNGEINEETYYKMRQTIRR